MGYRVEYPPIRKYRGVEQRRHTAAAWTVIFLLLFLVLVNLLWPEGAQVLRGLFLPEDIAVSAAALEDFAQVLKEGESFSSAFEAFCRRMIQDVQIASN